MHVNVTINIINKLFLTRAMNNLTFKEGVSCNRFSICCNTIILLIKTIYYHVF